jgi:hypothetical protein
MVLVALRLLANMQGLLDSTQVFGQAWLPDQELNIVALASSRIASQDEHPYDALQSINQSIKER